MNRPGKHRFFLLLLMFYLPLSVLSQPAATTETGFLRQFLYEKMPSFRYILDNPVKYRLQVIYTQIDRDTENKPSLKVFYLRDEQPEFFSPASLVKLPLSVMTLEKIDRLDIPGLAIETRFTEDSSYLCQEAVREDVLAPDSVPRFSNIIREALIVSDNEAYNRMYEFQGQQAINNRLRELGYADARIIQRFASCDSTENRHTNGFTFFDENGKIVYRQEPQYNTRRYPVAAGNLVVGKAYLTDYGRRIDRGMNFTWKNLVPLADIDDILKRIIFPAVYPEDKRFMLTKEELDYIRRNLALSPAESGIPALSSNKKDYWDALTNYLYYGCEKDAIPGKNPRIFNIVGQSYGFLSDCAYFADFENGVEFFLSATLYVNEDGILNDGKYEYATVGFPFLKELGRQIYRYELQRDRKVKPDLSEFRILFPEVK